MFDILSKKFIELGESIINEKKKFEIQIQNATDISSIKAEGTLRLAISKGKRKFKLLKLFAKCEPMRKVSIESEMSLKEFFQNNLEKEEKKFFENLNTLKDNNISNDEKFPCVHNLHSCIENLMDLEQFFREIGFELDKTCDPLKYIMNMAIELRNEFEEINIQAFFNKQLFLCRKLTILDEFLKGKPFEEIYRENNEKNKYNRDDNTKKLKDLLNKYEYVEFLKKYFLLIHI